MDMKTLKEQQKNSVKQQQIDPEKLAAIREKFAKLRTKLKESQAKSDIEM